MSITTEQEYYQELFRIQDENFPSQVVLLPSTEKILDVDLNTRTVEVPEYLSVVKDHKAETIYFKLNRYFDYMDLTNLACVIQYVNANKESHYYPVPFYDITTFSNEDKLIFPWVIDGAATKKAGPIEFSIRFYKIDFNNHHFVYNLTTLPAKGKILHGMDENIFNPEEYEISPDLYLSLQQEMAEIKQKVTDQFYWLTIEDVEGEN